MIKMPIDFTKETEAHRRIRIAKVREWQARNKDKCKQYINKLHNDPAKHAKNAERSKKWYREHLKEDLNKIIKAKINAHIDTDRAANRTYDPLEYITVEWVNEQLTKCESKCTICKKQLKLTKYVKNDPDQFSCDRIFNDTAHIKDNIIITCLACNFAHVISRMVIATCGDKDIGHFKATY